MPNPFDDLGKEPKVHSIKPSRMDNWDEIGGLFSCDYPYCAEKATVAWYNPQEQALQYTCKDGHLTRLEGFKL